MSVLPRTAYCQGLPKIFRKFDKYDYFWKEFAHLGEQEIKNSEIYYDVAPGNKSNNTFGYTARYNEYRYIPDTIHGQMLYSRPTSFIITIKSFPLRKHIKLLKIF